MMQLTRDILERHKDSHEHFEYYYTIIEKVENNVSKNPDISIESSKSLIEGICKSILLRLDSSFTKRKVNGMTFPKIFSHACERIGQHGELEVDFTYRAYSMIARMAELRNERADISHGKAAPKEYASTKATAKMVMHVTDSISAYILQSFFAIDLSYKDEIPYEDNPEFNDFLDELEPLEGVIYSQALYDQSYVTYEEQLRDYQDSLDQEELD